MRIYQAFSEVFGCEVQLSFNDNGILINYEIMSPQVESVTANVVRLVTSEKNFQELIKQSNLNVVRVQRNITFEMFWEAYGYKVGRHEAEAQWNKLSKVDQEAAYDYIKIYKARVKVEQVPMRHASTYLFKKTWR
jgi:hypothetical protein